MLSIAFFMINYRCFEVYRRFAKSFQEQLSLFISHSLCPTNIPSLRTLATAGYIKIRATLALTATAVTSECLFTQIGEGVKGKGAVKGHCRAKAKTKSGQKNRRRKQKARPERSGRDTNENAKFIQMGQAAKCGNKKTCVCTCAPRTIHR